ncbi:MAG: protein kinase [Pseudomonadota bacterium]
MSKHGSSLAEGTVVDHFRILRLLGEGGMGEVYLARDNLLGRRVALKLTPEGFLGSQDAVSRFMHEARITASFNHPHVVGIYAVGTYQERPYLALEYVEGQNLRQRLQEERPPGNPRIIYQHCNWTKFFPPDGGYHTGNLCCLRNIRLN